MKKRAISQIVTTILIILLVLAAIVILWNVVKKTISESAEEAGIEKFSVDLSTSQVEDFTPPFDISVTRNPGKGELVALKFIFKNAEGNTIEIQRNISEGYEMPGESESKNYLFLQADLGFSPVSYEVYPVIKTESGKDVIGIKASKKDGEKQEEVTEPEECVYGEWQDIGCGSGTCSLGEMYQTRIVIEGEGCDETSKCSVNATCELINSAVSYWKFEDNLNDEKGLNDLIFYGDAHIIDDAEKGKVLSLDGSGDYIKKDVCSGIDFAPDSFTVVSWIKPQQVTGSWRAILEYNRFGANWFGIWLSSGANFHFRVGSNTKNSIGILNPNEWYLLTATYDSSDNSMKLYIDGQFDSSAIKTSGFTSPVSSKLTIGVRGAEDTEFFKGAIDDAMIFNKALSDTEVETLYNYLKKSN